MATSANEKVYGPHLPPNGYVPPMDNDNLNFDLKAFAVVEDTHVPPSSGSATGDHSDHEEESVMNVQLLPSRLSAVLSQFNGKHSSFYGHRRLQMYKDPLFQVFKSNTVDW